MRIRYKFSELGKTSLKTREEAIKATDKAVEAMDVLIMTVNGLVQGKSILSKPFGWLLSHARTRKLTDEYIEYHYYLIDWLTTITQCK